ncbi:MAG: alpha-L-arabinofuranosidase C-terminal domain-containing protein, partial [Gemmatimonadota bacterium]
HSATVNHGGGLRKQRERVWANPVHWAHALTGGLSGGAPLPVELACEIFSTSGTYGHIPPMAEVPVLDAMAVRTPGGEVVITLVHRGAACGEVALDLEVAGFEAAAEAEVATLAAATWHERNTLEAPDRVAPVASRAAMTDGRRLHLAVAPFSLTRLTLRPR